MRKSYDFSKATQGTHFRSYEQGTEVQVLEAPTDKAVSRVPQKDTQLVELAGRHLIISQLTADGLEVALPIRDHGVDLIAYIDIDHQKRRFMACPIQLKVSTKPRFELSSKYERLSNLLLVYVWNVDGEKPEIFALTYKQAFSILHHQGYGETDSWKLRGRYSVATPSSELRLQLIPYKTGPTDWRERILSAASTEERRTA